MILEKEFKEKEFKVGYYYKYVRELESIYIMTSEMDMVKDRAWHKCIKASSNRTNVCHAPNYALFENMEGDVFQGYYWSWNINDFIEKSPLELMLETLKEIII